MSFSSSSGSSRGGSLTSASPFASMGPEMLADMLPEEQTLQSKVEMEPELEDFGEKGVYEDDADLDPLSAMEKYCRSELPQQRLAYAAGMGAAVELFQPHEVSGTMIALLRELLGDVYADVRLAALQQVLPIALRLRSAGTLYQGDIETLWDLVQKLLVDADVENQEAASSVLAELSHVVAKGNAVAASQKLVLAVQKLQRLPADLQAEGALAALRLIAEVVAPRQGSPLTFSMIQEFSVGTFGSMIGPEASPDVRQAVALLLPRFARHMPPALRASVVPGWVKSLAADTHWNVRAEVPQLLINLLTPQDKQQLLLEAAAGDSGSDGGTCTQAAGHAAAANKWGSARATATEAAAGSVADSWAAEDLRLLCDVCDRLCKDTSLQVKVAALASLGHLLPLLPSSLISSNKHPLLSHFAGTAKPPPQLAGVRVPPALCAPRLSGHLAALRHRQRHQRRQQQRAAEVRAQSYKQAVQELVQEADAIVESELQGLQGQQDDPAAPAASATAAPGGEATSNAAGQQQDSSSSSDAAAVGGSSDAVAAGGSSGAAAQSEDGPDRLLGTADDTPVGVDDTGSPEKAGRADAEAAGSSSAVGSDASSHQQQPQKAPAAAPGTAAAELPCACAMHIGKVVLHVSSECWPQLQGAFLELAVAAVNGDSNVAAALLLAFPELSEALGHQEAATILVPVVLELLHTHLDALTPVLSVLLVDVVSALAPELRICLLQMLPNLALQIDSELAGDWRARLAVAQQLAAVAALVTSAQVAYCLWPLLLSLARDPVCAVRAAAAQQAGPLLVLLPEQELPPAQSDQQKAAAAAAALKAAQEELHHELEAAPAGQATGPQAAAVATGSGSSDTAGGDDADAEAEHAIAAVVATRAVSAGSISGSSSRVTSDNPSAPAQQQQQDQNPLQLTVQQQQQEQQLQAAGGSGQRLRWVRRGLTSGLYQLQQQVDKVMESPGLQKVVNGVDQQLAWLQQHPQGKALWDLGSRLVRGSGADAAGAAGQDAQATLEDLRRQLTSLQVMESAELDPCKFLPTPAWHVLAAELLELGSSSNCSDRLVFVVAAGSILATYLQQQQQQGDEGFPAPSHEQQQQRGAGAGGGAGEAYLQQLLRQLQQLSSDPTPGVRCAVAAAASTLLAQGAAVQDLPMGAEGGPGTSGSAGQLGGSSNSPSGAPGRVQQQGPETPGCSGGGVSSLSSSGILSVPATASAVLQDCLQRLRLDACVSVAEAAATAGGSGGSCWGGRVGSSSAGGAAGAAAGDAAGAAMLGMQGGAEGGGDANRPAVGHAGDLL